MFIIFSSINQTGTALIGFSTGTVDGIIAS
jgi:formate hydrogenlyase subunit 3/multisubunit Na+/H+ antiporter MnhD subunit